jgi:putative two-component system response regulator
MKALVVVDDNVTSLKQIASFLQGHYDYYLIRSGAEAISTCVRESPDLIILDVEMPDMDGFETIKELKNNPVTSQIPVIFLTATQDTVTEVTGLKFGARDFIRKPIEKNILLHRLGLHLDISSYQKQLEDSVRSTADSFATSISELIECRDENTGGHVARTSKYVEKLGRKLLERGLFGEELTPHALEMMVRAAPLHDVGKIAVSDRILLKPGKLTVEEFELMKKHSEIGAKILEKMYARTPSQAYLKYAVLIAETHHEKYNGTGYPKGLSGKKIPLCGKIMAVADVYDALVENRIYRKEMSHEQAFGIIMDGKGTHFDPYVVDAFEATHQQFGAVKEQLYQQ